MVPLARCVMLRLPGEPTTSHKYYCTITDHMPRGHVLSTPFHGRVLRADSCHDSAIMSGLRSLTTQPRGESTALRIQRELADPTSPEQRAPGEATPIASTQVRDVRPGAHGRDDRGARSGPLGRGPFHIGGDRGFAKRGSLEAVAFAPGRLTTSR